MSKPKPQTPEFKRILERMKNRKREKAQMQNVISEKGMKIGQNSENRTINTDAEMQLLVDEKHKESPPIKPPPPKKNDNNNQLYVCGHMVDGCAFCSVKHFTLPFSY